MILVTGGTGMLGSYLLLELTKSNKQVFASKRINSSTAITKQIFKAFSESKEDLFSKIKWVNVDLFSQNDIEENLTGIKEIYHCAAYISSSSKDKAFLIENNRLITENLVNAALNVHIEKFCHVSSISALGNARNGELISETTFWKEQKNNSTYSTSKYYSEMEVWRAMAEGLNAVIVNPAVILGVGNWEKGSANLFKKINDGIKFYTLGSSGFVNATDVVRIMTQLMSCKDCFGQGYIISAENIDFKTLFGKIAESLSVTAPKIYATTLLTQLAWRIEWVKSKVSGIDPLITKESARTAHKVLKYNNTKLLDTISFKYQTVDNTIKEIAAIYKS